MSSLLYKVPEIAESTTEEKLAMIDELWEVVRQSGSFPIPDSHLKELNQRVEEVMADPARALAPAEARNRLKK